ncbi:hypothetical protein DESA109040_11485 [Deinococcus saxicola]
MLVPDPSAPSVTKNRKLRLPVRPTAATATAPSAPTMIWLIKVSSS